MKLKSVIQEELILEEKKEKKKKERKQIELNCKTPRKFCSGGE